MSNHFVILLGVRGDGGDGAIRTLGAGFGSDSDPKESRPSAGAWAGAAAACAAVAIRPTGKAGHKRGTFKIVTVGSLLTSAAGCNQMQAVIRRRHSNDADAVTQRGVQGSF